MKKLCYRCTEPTQAIMEFAGYPYCEMCFRVVSFMNSAVAHDPPVGFPGGRPGMIGWEEIQIELRKREEEESDGISDSEKQAPSEVSD